MTIPTNYLETLALYNKWQNESLFAICDRLSDLELRRSRGMFFDSIFKKLNHIIHVDETIHSIIHARTASDFNPNFEPYADFEALKLARAEFDDRLVRETQEILPASLDDCGEIWSDRLQRNRRIPKYFYYLQMFNHQTHHRSQITSELHKMGIDYGSTDLPFNPYYQF